MSFHSRHSLLTIALIITIGFSFGQQTATNSRKQAVDFLKKKKAVLGYMEKCIRDSLVIIGQFAENGNLAAAGYKTNFDTLNLMTGELPAIVGLEYGYNPDVDISLVNKTAIEHSNKGGLVTITWHADNPWVEGYNCRWNSVKNKEEIDPTRLLKSAPQSKEKYSYRRELEKVAVGLKQLRDAGVVVLWRPFHEMNGSWFWWGTDNQQNPGNTAKYMSLWKDMYRTFTQDYKLDNLIWIYSPGASSEYVPSVDKFYPGSDFVDAVAADIYTPNLYSFDDYQQLKKLNKPICVGEVGPPFAKADGTYDNFKMFESFRGRAAYFLQWASWKGVKMSIKDNVNARKMMNDKAAVTLRKLQQFQ